MIAGNNTKKLIYDLTCDELEQEVLSWGEPKYRVRQIWQGLYKELYASADDFTTLPLKLRRLLAEKFTFQHLTPRQSLASREGETQKTLFTLPDGQGIETVLMQYRERRTLCISTQAGCAMGCVFCATGQMGYRRNLTSGEIIEQVIYFARRLSLNNEKITNVVVMGMGEPFHNYDGTLSAIDRLNDPEGFTLGARRFTISTVGLIPGIKRFTKEHRQVNLAISLHAAEDDLRSSLLPINRKYPLSELIDTCVEYVEATHRRITFEWALIQGVNDGVDQAKKLAFLLRPLVQNGIALCHVNVIPLNPTQRYNGKATTHGQAEAFRQTLESYGIPCTIRIRRGIEIQAGCGQLAAE
jgi:23S rRNA (adenine2503-C2)-methyltransferase